jgi:hypothetical protein
MCSCRTVLVKWLKCGEIHGWPMQRPCQKANGEDRLSEGSGGRKCRKKRIITDAFRRIALAPTSIIEDLHFMQNYSSAVKWFLVLLQATGLGKPINHGTP